MKPLPLWSLSKTPETGAYALSSPSRTTSLLISKKSDGRIAYDSREKEDTLSLKCENKPSASPFSFLHTFGLLLCFILPFAFLFFFSFLFSSYFILSPFLPIFSISPFCHPRSRKISDFYRNYNFTLFEKVGFSRGFTLWILILHVAGLSLECTTGIISPM